MSVEQHKAAVRYWYLVAGACSVERNAYLHVDRQALGPASLIAVVTSLRQAFPDIHFAIAEQTVDGENIITHWTACATRSSALLAAPVCTPFHTSGRSVERFAAGRLVCSQVTLDLPDLMQHRDGEEEQLVHSGGSHS